MGNRGIIHDPTTRSLLTKRWSTKAWITCRCDYKGIQRAVMATKSWTELFFLDEATVLAAGHRPCFLCRRDAAQAFRMAWAAGHGGQLPAAPQIDAVLHSERVQGGAKRIHALTYGVAELPDGAMTYGGMVRPRQWRRRRRRSSGARPRARPRRRTAREPRATRGRRPGFHRARAEGTQTASWKITPTVCRLPE